MTRTTADDVDLGLAQTIVDQIINHPETHFQPDYVTITRDLDERGHDAARLAEDGDADAIDRDYVLYAPGTSPACGTALCVAGWATLLRGYGFLFESYDSTATQAIPPGELPRLHALIEAGETHQAREDALDSSTHVHDAAIHELGLNPFDADALFAGANTLADVLALFYMITDGRIRFPRIVGEHRADMAVVLVRKIDQAATDMFHGRARQVYTRYAARNRDRLTDERLVEGQPLPWAPVA